MKIVILQSNYIPWKGYFELINESDIFCFFDEVQYTKRDWRNRNLLMNYNGKFWMTVPVSKETTKGKISEVEFIDSSWQKKHFQKIEKTYFKSPFKNEVLDFLYPFYIEKNWSNLSEFNQTMIMEISKYIGCTTKFVNSRDFDMVDGKVDRLINLVKKLNGTTYITGTNAKNYLENYQQSFIENEINLTFKKYGPYLKYNTTSKIYDDYVSIIDLMMNVPQNELIKYITSQNHADIQTQSI
jgi:hypothetical protein